MYGVVLLSMFWFFTYTFLLLTFKSFALFLCYFINGEWYVGIMEMSDLILFCNWIFMRDWLWVFCGFNVVVVMFIVRSAFAVLSANLLLLIKFFIIVFDFFNLCFGFILFVLNVYGLLMYVFFFLFLSLSVLFCGVVVGVTSF